MKTIGGELIKRVKDDKAYGAGISRRDSLLWLLAIVGLIVSLPLFSPHVVLGHDVYFHLLRIEGIKEALLGGQFPVRVEGCNFNGYGTPAGFFYPSLFLYIPVLLRLAGMPLALAYNFFGLLINLATVFIAWWSFAKFLGSRQVGAWAAMLYAGFLYRLLDMYYRSAIGEAIAMAFFPLALAGVWLVLYRAPRYWWAVVLGFTGVLQSHLISSLMLLGVTILIAAFGFGRLCHRETALAAMKAALFTLLLNVWFYVPFFSMYRQIDFHIKNQVKVDHILSINALGWPDMAAMQFFCGYGLLAILLLFFLLLINSQLSRANYRYDGGKKFLFLLDIGTVLVIAASASFPWSGIEDLPFIGAHIGVMQFPFRWLMLAAVFLSLGGGLAVAGAASRLHKAKAVAFGLCLLAVGSNMFFLVAHEPLVLQGGLPASKLYNWYLKYDDCPLAKAFPIAGWPPGSPYANRPVSTILYRGSYNNWGYYDYLYHDLAFADVFGHPGPDDVKTFLESSVDGCTALPIDDVQPADSITGFRKQGMTLSFAATTEEPLALRLPLFYYPGYEAQTSAGQMLAVTEADKHRLQVNLPTGNHEVTVRYAGKKTWQATNVISLIGLLLFGWRLRRENIL